MRYYVIVEFTGGRTLEYTYYALSRVEALDVAKYAFPTAFIHVWSEQ